jgi:FeS assembly SUF system regulator
MLRLTKLTDYALITVAELARCHGSAVRAAALADNLQLPEPTVRKVLKVLTKGGICQSLRGAGGGYRLAESPADISVAAVVALFEGPVAVTACHGSAGSCVREAYCSLRPHLNGISAVLRNALETIPISLLLQDGSLRRVFPRAALPMATQRDGEMENGYG